MDAGRVAADGPMEDVVRQYLGSSDASNAGFEASELEAAPGNELIRLRGVRIKDHEGRSASSVDGRYPVFIEIEYVILRASPVRTAFRLATAEGVIIFTSTDVDDEGRYGRIRDPGVYVSRCEIPPRLLKRGMHFVTVMSDISMVKVNFHLENVVRFSVDVVEGMFEDNRQGVVSPAFSWDIEKVSDLDGVVGRDGASADGFAL
jgi:lipopolysaccharide transport system ATP-binding protein